MKDLDALHRKHAELAARARDQRPFRFGAAALGGLLSERSPEDVRAEYEARDLRATWGARAFEKARYPSSDEPDFTTGTVSGRLRERRRREDSGITPEQERTGLHSAVADAQDDASLEELRKTFAPLAYENTVGTGWLERLREAEGPTDLDPTTGSVSGRLRAAAAHPEPHEDTDE